MDYQKVREEIASRSEVWWWIRHGWLWKLDDWSARLRWAWQRAYRGYDDTAYWGLDAYLTEIILPVLKSYKEDKLGTPYTEGENGEWGHDEARWEKELDKMIDAFQLMRDDDYMEGGLDTIPHEEQQARIRAGLESFSKYFRALWT